MPQLEPQQFYQKVEKALETQEFAPLYFFFGEEPYLIQQAVNYVKVCSLHGGAADFNFSSFYSADADLSAVRDAVDTLPWMSSRRVVILRDVPDLTDKEWDILEPLFQSPVDSTVFILVGSKIDKRKRVMKLLIEQAQTIEFKRPFESQISGWIRHICKGHGLEISDEAVQLLHRLAGNHLTEIESEIKKLVDFLGDRKQVELEDVAQCVSQKREESVFELTEMIARTDRVNSLIQLVRLMDQGQSEMGIVALVARHFRILLLIKQGESLGLSGQKLAHHAQVSPYFLGDYVKQARNWTAKKIESALVVLAETDKALKSSPVSAHIWLENLIYRTCALHQSPAGGSAAEPKAGPSSLRL
ncbi:MAG: DNA polymerase III subunit delta [Bdellovibrio sp.]